MRLKSLKVVKKEGRFHSRAVHLNKGIVRKKKFLRLQVLKTRAVIVAAVAATQVIALSPIVVHPLHPKKKRKAKNVKTLQKTEPEGRSCLTLTQTLFMANRRSKLSKICKNNSQKEKKNRRMKRKSKREKKMREEKERLPRKREDYRKKKKKRRKRS